MSDDTSTPVALFKTPGTPADFAPPRSMSASLEMQTLLRNKKEYAQIKPYLDAVSGAGPSLHGSARYDEAGLVFLVEKISKSNGYTLLEDKTPAELSRLLKAGIKSATKFSFRSILKQGRLLRLALKNQQNMPQAPTQDHA